MKITAIIVIHKNPKYLEQSLLSIVDEVDEIVIGDVGMTAKITPKVNQKAKIIKLESNIPFADLVKEDLKKHASGDFILYLDPDEIVPQKLWSYLKDKLKEYDYFLLPRKNILFGKWIEHGRWWPDYQLRFFKKNAVIWPKTIHPVPVGMGNKHEVPAVEDLAIIHYNYDSISHYLEKAIRYSQFEASELYDKKITFTLHQAIKKSLNEFVSRYFANDGYKDGMHGFVLAFLQLFYYMLVYFFYWEKNEYKDESKDQLPHVASSFFSTGLFEINFWLRKKNLITGIKKLKNKIQNLLVK